ncbi:MAG: hypothetical protein ABS36_15935 [Acidobacteria bacterium SCN 69-37]|nr:MAG: hypothetical protein ABS36_15935 [Acidobacteria bacterium SCN 69-37]
MPHARAASPRPVFPPIAIIGQACVLPGVLSPDALWRAVVEGRDLITSPPPGAWGAEASAFLRRPGSVSGDGTVSDRGGYVSGFDDIFNPEGFAVSAASLSGLDPVCLWLLHCGREALASSGYAIAPRARAGLVVGNLSYPTAGHTAFAFDTWLSVAGSSRPENRFSSGYPAQLAARALALGQGGFALDAACASSLYALKLACDRLHDGEADLMLAAAVNHADSLFLHIGFTALQALSPSGQSRPFHRDADGLLPAEGAACVVLKRLDDAERDGDPVLGVIRGIGVSNDGTRRGLLTPDVDGQIEAITSAYAQAGVDPATVSLLECHATGTSVGDAVEVASAAAVFGAARDLPIGSLKSNLGHLITAAGLAGLLKVIAAMHARVRPATLHVDQPIAAFAGTPLRPLRTAESWETDGPRRAGLSAFGFGGCNAHAVIEQWQSRAHRSVVAVSPPPGSRTVAVCAMHVVTGAGHGEEAFWQRLIAPVDPQASCRIDHAEIDARGLRFPPRNLAASLPQQTLVLEAACAAMATMPVDPGRTGVIVGMGCDPEVTRFGLRWRAPDRVGGDFCPPLTTAGVVGTMPNVPANRLNVQVDARAFGYTVSAEELSGVTALRLAARALAAGDVDTVIVGAAEVTGDRVHEAAATALLPRTRHRPGDAAVAMVVTTEVRARALGLPVRALVDVDAIDGHDEIDRQAHVLDDAADLVTSRFGHAHAASGLLHLAAGVLACERAMRPSRAAAHPWIAPRSERRLIVRVSAFDGETATCTVRAGDRQASPSPGPIVVLIGATDARDLGRLLREDGSRSRVLPGAPLRLAIVADDEVRLRASVERVCRQIEAGDEPAGEGVWYSRRPTGGRVAFAFPGAAAAYAGAGRELLASLPELAECLAVHVPDLADLAVDVLDRPTIEAPFDQLRACTLTSQIHARLCLDLLGLRPDAAIGLSSGETNALVAFGVWRDPGGLIADVEASGMYGHHLTGPCESARQAWGLPAGTPVDWMAWRVLASPDTVRAIIVRLGVRATVTIVNAPDDCVIAGDRAACDRVIAELGPGRAIDLKHPMVVHCAELAPFADTWRRVHTRPTHSAPGIAFYANAFNGPYTPTESRVAEALTVQARTPIDFPRTVRRAWDDGIRVFLELGPRDTVTRAIGRILGDRAHVAIALDDPATAPRLRTACAVARLHVAGVDVTEAALARVFGTRPAPSDALPLRFATRQPPFAPDGERAAREDAVTTETAQVMAPAPALPRVARSNRIVRRPEPPRPPVVAIVPMAGRRRIVEDVTRLHREFIEQQTTAYRRYVGVEARLIERLQPVARVSSPVLTIDAPAVTCPATTHSVAVAEPPLPLPPREEEPAHDQAIARRQAPTTPAGPTFDRAALEILAGGRISTVLGPAFSGQDGYRRQVRLPEPPMLLVDRVVGIEGAAGSMGRGTIWTETDVRADSWYLHQAHMPPGILIESGQADLLLISWLGVDALNRDTRVYRLLGCELTFRGDRLPAPGDTLHYEIHVDGHAQVGDVRLFFFHYDAWIGDRLWISVRNGQAGFFTDAELAESGGVLWDASTDTPAPGARLDPPPRPSVKRAFSRADLDAFVAGDAATCFGEGFEETASHQRTPTIASGRLRLIDEVTAFDPHGGPWGRGYLRAETDVPADAWFYQGHFTHDPCMPGTLMAEAAVQAQSFLLAALGFTIPRDGWRFEPVVDEAYTFVCRGQVIPDGAHRLTYEVFVEEIVDGDCPRVYAALLCRSDGFKVFHCRRLGMTIVPDWPLSTRQALVADTPVHVVDPTGPVRGDHAALLACAWGRPSDAFGPMYAAFDGARRAPRLPGPPYHFMTHVEHVTCPSGRVTEGGRVTARYDVPPDAWYFDANASPTMPMAVLMEVMLQPCGWLASYMGIAAHAPTDLRFRNLDGRQAVVVRHVPRGTSHLNTTATLTRFARAGETTLVFFSVEGRDDQGVVLAFDTSFGFFTDAALAGQTGLPEPSAPSADEGPPAIADVTMADLKTRAGWPALASAPLLMIDHVAAFWPAGGAAGLGRIRGRQQVHPDSWYFKAHFYQDPVQPGSLGIEALIQLLQVAMCLGGLHTGMRDPVFDPIASGAPLTWRYRGQVLPRHGVVDTEIAITCIDRQGDRVVCTARGSLWCDGLRIYELPDLAMALVDRGAAAAIELTPERVQAGWRRLLQVEAWPGEALMTALYRRFVRRVSFRDPAAFARVADRPALYLANHQTGVESILFGFALGGGLERRVVALAKDAHAQSWLGGLYAWLSAYPGVRLPRMALYVNREDRADMLGVMEDAGRLLREAETSLLVHVEGTRSTRAGTPVTRVSAVLFDLMAAAQAPIVPVRFLGGLPASGDGGRLEFPSGLGQQEIVIGSPIDVDDLRPLSLREKQRVVLDAINGLGDALDREVPQSSSPDVGARVARLAAEAGIDPVRAIVLDTVMHDTDAARVFAGVLDDAGRPRVPSTAMETWEQTFLAWVRGPRA